MVNPVTGRRPALSPADVVALDPLSPGGLHSSWLEFLLRYNVGVPARAWCRARGFRVAHFFGVSPVPGEDFATMVSRHEGRLAPRHVPVADAEDGHLVCMDAAGRIHFWDRHVHDRDRVGIATVEPPVRLADSLDEFLEGLVAVPAARQRRAEDIGTAISSEDFTDLFRPYRIDEDA